MSNYSGSKLNLNNKNTNWYKAFNLIKENSTVLDIGCSNGTFGYELITRKNCVVDGIEIDKDDAIEASKILRKVHNLNIEIDSLNEVNEKYDYIFMGDVVEHFARPIETLKKVKSLLHGNGSLVFSIPNMLHMSVRLMFLEGKIEYGETGLLDKTHLHFYSAKEIKRVFNAAGYTITELDYVAKPLKEEHIANSLNKIGLLTTKEFHEISKSIDSIAYQYIGVAKIASKKISSQTLKFRSPEHINTFDKYVKDTIDYHRSKYIVVKKDYEAVLKTNNALSKELEQIKNSKYWKLYVNLKRTVKRNKVKSE